MAMTVQALKQMLSGVSGGTFSITAVQIGVDTVTTLFGTYLPNSTLGLDSATGDADTLTVTGQLTLGSTSSIPTTAVFIADPNATLVSGITITAALPAWALDSPPALVFSVTTVGQYLSAPELVLSAGGNDPSASAPAAALNGNMVIQAKDGSHTIAATAVIPASVDGLVTPYEFHVETDFSLGDPNALAQFVTGANFNIIPSQIPVADELQLSWVDVIVDPLHDQVLALKVDVGSTEPLDILTGFSIPSFDFVFFVPFPAASTNVSVVASATIDIYGQIVDVSITLPSPLFVQGDLGQDSPVPLKPFINNFLSTNNIPDDFEISALQFGINIQPPNNWTFEIQLSNLWLIPLWGTTQLQLENLLVALWNDTGTETPGLEVNLRYSIGGTDLYLTAIEDQGDWTFSGGTVGYQPINFIPLLQDMANQFNLDSGSLPDSLTELELTTVQLSFSTVGGAKEFTFALAGQLAISDVTVTANLSADIKAASGANAFSASFAGSVTITTPSTNVVFNVNVQRQGAATLILGTLNSENTPLQLQDLLSSVGFNPQIPAGIDISLQDLGIVYQAQTDSGTGVTTSTFIITANSANYGKALFIAQRQSGTAATTTYIFGVDPAISGSLSQIPLIGKDIPSSLNLSLSDLEVLFVSRPLSTSDVSGINQLLSDLAQYLPKDSWQLPSAGVASDVELSLALALGDKPTTFDLDIGGRANSQSASAAAQAAAPADSSGSSSLKWLSVQKSLGPLYVNRLGVGYSDGDVEFALDASLTFSALSISLTGLSVSSPLTSFDPRFGLQGMSLTMNAGPLQLAGGFLSTTPNGLNDSTWEYAGELVIKADVLTISAIGAYGRFDGNPSFFIFAMLDAPLGGPSFFFVTGLAGGFGYNRNLVIPTLDQLPNFPLVQGAMSGATGNNPFAGKTNNPAAALQVLDQYLPMSWARTGWQRGSLLLHSNWCSRSRC
jgi:Family of unknown function (DUF6603)